MVATEPVLQYCLMHLSSNASKDDLGAVIVQLHNDKCLTNSICVERYDKHQDLLCAVGEGTAWDCLRL